MDLDEKLKLKHKIKQIKIEKWKKKTAKSPFKVNLVADNERLDEENRIRLQEEAKRNKEIEKRKKEVKNEIILKALAESSDLEALRREKRAIIDEEKRLKALLDLEKTNSKKKADMLAAQNAERHRKQIQNETKRMQQKIELQEKENMYKELLKEKLDI